MGLIKNEITAILNKTKQKDYYLLYHLTVSQYHSWLEWQGLSWFEKRPGTQPARCTARLIAFLVFIYVIDNSGAALRVSALMHWIACSCRHRVCPCREEERNGDVQRGKLKEEHRKGQNQIHGKREWEKGKKTDVHRCVCVCVCVRLWLMIIPSCADSSSKACVVNKVCTVSTGRCVTPQVNDPPHKAGRQRRLTDAELQLKEQICPAVASAHNWNRDLEQRWK